MRCKRCGKKAIVYLRQNKLALCGDCFTDYYLKFINRTIRRYSILRRDEKILAAVSGGKDSAVMSTILKLLDFDLELLHINLGIDDYSKNSERYSRLLAEFLDLNLHIIELENYGFTISAVYKKNSKRACSACGIAKRYIMNKFARENSFDVVATGHTVEDVVSLYIKNMASGSKAWSEKLLPRNEPFDPKIIAKAKPLFFGSEKENLVFAIVNKIPFLIGNCPYAPNPIWKEILYNIELKKPGFTRNFARAIISKDERLKVVNYCKECGEVTNADLCSFCKLKKAFG